MTLVRSLFEYLYLNNYVRKSSPSGKFEDILRTVVIDAISIEITSLVSSMWFFEDCRSKIHLF